jgi:predicted lipoprotein with Yx(FWY)xxD motif
MKSIATNNYVRLVAILLLTTAVGAPTALASQAVVKTALNKLLKKTIVVDGSGRTLYMLTADTSGTSTCAAISPDCPKVWHAFTTSGKPLAGTGLRASLLGTTKGNDGKEQVTYNHHPLYYFHGGLGFGTGDKKPGDVNGQGVENAFYVLSPKGTPIRK